MDHFIEGLISGLILGPGALFYLVRHGKIDIKKTADALAALANKAKRK